MALILIPVFPHSVAKDCVIACIPLLDIADGTVKAEPVQTHVARIEIIFPPIPSSNHLLPTECVT